MKTYGTENSPIIRSDITWGESHTVKASKRKFGNNSEGDIHNTYRNVENKRRDRRALKRIARQNGKNEIANALADLQ